MDDTKKDILIGALFLGYLLIFIWHRYEKSKAEYPTKVDRDFSSAYILFTWFSIYWWFFFGILYF